MLMFNLYVASIDRDTSKNCHALSPYSILSKPRVPSLTNGGRNEPTENVYG